MSLEVILICALCLFYPYVHDFLRWIGEFLFQKTPTVLPNYIRLINLIYLPIHLVVFYLYIFGDFSIFAGWSALQSSDSEFKNPLYLILIVAVPIVLCLCSAMYAFMSAGRIKNPHVLNEDFDEEKQKQVLHRMEAFRLIIANQRLADVVAPVEVENSNKKQKKLGMIWSIYLDYALETLVAEFDLGHGWQHDFIEALINDEDWICDDMFVTIENYNAAKVALANKSDFAMEVLDKAHDAIHSAIDGNTLPFAYELLTSKADF